MKKRCRSAFTLVELILVMIVIFTIATVVAPRMTDFFPGFRLQKSVEHLYAWARKARGDAATTGLRQRLLLDPTSHKYWIEYEARPFKEPGKFVMLSGAWGEEKLPDEVRFDTLEGPQVDPSHGERRYLEFRPDGTATEATITLINERYDRKVLRVEGPSSKVYIQTQEQKP